LIININNTIKILKINMKKNLHEELLQLIEAEPTNESVLDLLCQIDDNIQKIIESRFQWKRSERLEEKINWSIFKAFKDNETGYSINNYLDIIINRVEKILGNSEKNISEILSELWIFALHHSQTLLIANENKNKWVIKWSWEWYVESYNNDKLKSLLEILNWLWIYWDDIICHIWGVEKNMMRKYWYIYIQIPQLNRSVLISDGSWENTFVIKWLPKDAYFFQSTKIDIFNDFEVDSIPYTKRWWELILEKLQEDFIPKIKMKEKISMFTTSELLNIFQNDKRYHPDILMKSSAKNLKQINIWWYNLTQIARLFHIKGAENILWEVRPENKKLHLAYLLKSIFWVGYESIMEVINLSQSQEKAPKEASWWKVKSQQLGYFPEVLLSKTQAELKLCRVCGFTLSEIAWELKVADTYGIKW